MHMRGKTICEFSEAGCIPTICRDTENSPGDRAGWLSTPIAASLGIIYIYCINPRRPSFTALGSDPRPFPEGTMPKQQFSTPQYMVMGFVGLYVLVAVVVVVRSFLVKDKEQEKKKGA